MRRPDIFLLKNAPMNYDWGDCTAIASLQGRQPTSRPEAEIWFGTHPRSPAYLSDGRLLASALEEHGISISYLVKLLAAAKPLSIQVHPNSAQARAGFAREKHLDSASKNYRDRYEKSEMLIAISDTFSLLCGFRPKDELFETLNHFSLVSKKFKIMRDLYEQHGLKCAIAWFFENANQSDIDLLCEGRMPYESQNTTISDLKKHHVNEPGFVLAVLMSRVNITRGQSVFVQAGTLHSYLKGFGVEIMTNSDNVIRAGLTTKHIDTVELQKVALFKSEPVCLLQPHISNSGASRRFCTPYFTVEEVTLSGNEGSCLSSTIGNCAYCNRDSDSDLTSVLQHDLDQKHDGMTEPSPGLSEGIHACNSGITCTSESISKSATAIPGGTFGGSGYTLRGTGLVLVTAGVVHLSSGDEELIVRSGFAAFVIDPSPSGGVFLTGCGVCYIVTDDNQFDIIAS
ncbi:mannose-6-phosphate isomerase, class I [Tropheryma whipplei]|uniref:mannose-6-phosphate isomerase, class I n=1 Tax=Tropheryma whipplei TaxID=2039 RepID=UPI00056F548C|nr:mannose-6-phosphate isomerase, class I [Tropheryma whipplei]